MLEICDQDMLEDKVYGDFLTDFLLSFRTNLSGKSTKTWNSVSTMVFGFIPLSTSSPG